MGGVLGAVTRAVTKIGATLRDVQNGVRMAPGQASRYIQRFGAKFNQKVARHVPDVEAPKGARDVDDFIIPGQKWYHGTDVDSADDIIRNGLDRKKLLGSDPVEGADTPGFFVTDKLSDAKDYARLRGGERGKPGSILEWDDTEIGRFLEGVGKDNEAVIPFDVFDSVPRPRRPGG